MSQSQPDPLYYVIHPAEDGGFLALEGDSESASIPKTFKDIEEALAWAEEQSETADVLIHPDCLHDAIDNIVLIEVIDTTTNEGNENDAAST